MISISDTIDSTVRKTKVMNVNNNLEILDFSEYHCDICTLSISHIKNINIKHTLRIEILNPILKELVEVTYDNTTIEINVLEGDVKASRSSRCVSLCTAVSGIQLSYRIRFVEANNTSVIFDVSGCTPNQSCNKGIYYIRNNIPSLENPCYYICYIINPSFEDIEKVLFSVGDTKNHENITQMLFLSGYYKRHKNYNFECYSLNLLYPTNICSTIIGSGSTLKIKLDNLGLGMKFILYTLLKLLLSILLFNEINVEWLYRFNYNYLIRSVSNSIYKNALPYLRMGNKYEMYYRGL